MEGRQAVAMTMLPDDLAESNSLEPVVIYAILLRAEWAFLCKMILSKKRG
jgi:hypothetical protein